MDLKTLPFIVSIIWEALSPAVSLSIERILRKYTQDINDQEDRKTCIDLVKYTQDSLQMVSGLLMTLVAFTTITFPEIKQIYWNKLLTLSFILTAAFIVLIIYALTYNPYKWVAKRYLIWSRGTTCAITLNIILMGLILILPTIKEIYPQIFKTA